MLGGVRFENGIDDDVPAGHRIHILEADSHGLVRKQRKHPGPLGMVCISSLPPPLYLLLSTRHEMVSTSTSTSSPLYLPPPYLLLSTFLLPSSTSLPPVVNQMATHLQELIVSLPWSLYPTSLPPPLYLISKS